MFVGAALSWGPAPDRIPVHWGISGPPDRYGGKVEGLLGPPLIALGIYLLMLVLPRVDPRRENYEKFARTYALIRTVAVALVASIHGLVLLWAHGRTAAVNVMIPVVVGIAVVVLGDRMGKLRPNWFIGVRTPWTLSSSLSWTKTHRLTGKLMVIAGLLMIVGSLMVRGTVPRALIIIAPLIIAMIVAVAYSYVVWRDDAHRAQTAPGRDPI